MNWGILVDVIILGLLGVTIYYAARLSVYLKTFHDGRKDMNFLIQDLSTSVSRAENAIKGMQASADQSGQKLQDVINEAKFLSDELRFMNEAGDSLANRLEKLAERNRELVDLLEQAGGVGHPNQNLVEAAVPAKPYHERPGKAVKLNPPAKEQSFAIQDREYDDFEDYDEPDDEDVFLLDEAFQPDAEPVDTQSKSDMQLKSQAERDLYEALRRRSAHRQRRDKVS